MFRSMIAAIVDLGRDRPWLRPVIKWGFLGPLYVVVWCVDYLRRHIDRALLSTSNAMAQVMWWYKAASTRKRRMATARHWVGTLRDVGCRKITYVDTLPEAERATAFVNLATGEHYSGRDGTGVILGQANGETFEIVLAHKPRTRRHFWAAYHEAGHLAFRKQQGLDNARALEPWLHEAAAETYALGVFTEVGWPVTRWDARMARRNVKRWIRRAGPVSMAEHMAACTSDGLKLTLMIMVWVGLMPPHAVGLRRATRWPSMASGFAQSDIEYKGAMTPDGRALDPDEIVAEMSRMASGETPT